MQKTILTLPLFILYAYFCNTSHVAYPNITDENFRERVKIWEQDHYHFYTPIIDDSWSACIQGAKRNYFRSEWCKLRKFTPNTPLNVKHYEISFKSSLPIKKEWMDTVIHEFFNQEKLSYFTVYYIESSTYNFKRDETGRTEQDYKNCNNTSKDSDYCVHRMLVRLLAYNDQNTLRNGVIWDIGYEEDGELFMFYNLYTSGEVQTYERKSDFWVEDYTNQAWEVTKKVDTSQWIFNRTYNIQRYSESNLASIKRPPIDFSKEFDSCRKRIADENDGRFSNQDECYCNCVQEQMNENVKKLDNPDKMNIEIINASYCIWLKSIPVLYYNQQLKELLDKNTALTKYEECRLKVYAKYARLKNGSVDICNVGDIITNIVKCNHK